MPSDQHIRYPGVHALQFTNSWIGYHFSTSFTILFTVSAFSFLSSCCTVMSQESDVWWQSWPPEIHGWNLFFLPWGCRCGMLHSKFNKNYTSCSKFSLEIAKITTPVDLKLSFGLVISQILARLHEIAKINTRKIVTIAKTQNFVLANNRNNKVEQRFSAWVNSWW